MKTKQVTKYKMKRMILLSLFIAPVIAWAQDNSFTIKAKVGSAVAPARVYLNYRSGGKLVTDSATVDKGIFTFKGAIDGPTNAQLVFDHAGFGLARLGRDADVLMMYLEKGDINIAGKDSVKTAVISGSKLNDENIKYKASVASADAAMAMINAEYKAAPADKKNDQTFMDGLEARFNKAKDEKQILQQKYIKQNTDSYISLLALVEIAGSDPDVSVIEPVFKSLSANVRNTTGGQAFAKQIEAARATSIGALAPVFTQNDVNDKPVSLADFKGKYVLLDFWASWCGPCRGENPNVVKAYNQCKGKNFTVLGVSLDRPGKKDDWLAAIKADGLEWTQVSDLNFWDNQVAKLYGIRAIPQNYLIDPNGKIIGKNLRGDELNKKLATLFN
jgi:peroxiredoxin